MARICITRTEGEWKAIMTTFSELGKKQGLNYFIKIESNRLINEFKACPDCITPAEGEKIEKQFVMSDEEYRQLKIIAEKMKKTISSVIDDLVISPLLLPK